MTDIFKNNQRLKKTDLVISLDDRSFKFGDGCFETIPFYNQKCFMFKEHLKRLEAGLRALHIDLDLKHIEVQAYTLIHDSDIQDGFVRVLCSRGEGSIGFLPSADCKAYYIIELVKRVGSLPSETKLFVSSYKRINPSQLPIHSKLNNGLNSVLARIEAKQHGCFEALQLSEEGYVSEGSSSNICWLHGNRLYMPSESCNVLPGITQSVLEQISPIQIMKGEYRLKHVFDADEVYLTNSAWEICPVHTIHGYKKVYETKMFKKLAVLFKRYRSSE